MRSSRDISSCHVIQLRALERDGRVFGRVCSPGPVCLLPPPFCCQCRLSRCAPWTSGSFFVRPRRKFLRVERLVDQLNPNKMTRQLLTCAVAVVFFAALGAATILPVCPPGSHRTPGSGGEGKSCLTCQPCSPGRYMDEFNRYTRCKGHRECGKDEDEMVSGTNTSDVVCRCRSGGRLYYNVDDKASGYDCLPCTDGDVAKNVTMGMDRGHTACCPPDSQAFRTRHGHVDCRRPGESGVTSQPPTPRAATTSLPPTSSCANEDSCQWKTYFIAAVTPLAAALALAIISIVYLIVILKRQQRTRSMSVSDEEDKFSLDSNT